MVKDFDKSLSDLKGTSVMVSPSNVYPDLEHASIKLLFSNQTWVRAEYWRVVKDDRAGVSSFDHRQKYGLPAPIDAIEELQALIQGKCVKRAYFENKTGDLFFEFGSNVLQVFNFTGYEIWEINFPNGTGEYSNYAK